MKHARFIHAGLIGLTLMTFGTGLLHAQEKKQIEDTKTDAIVVTATREETPAFDAPASVVLVDREELERSQALTLKDAIDHIPNVDFNNNSTGAIQRPSIRGLGQEQVIIKIDGVRQTFRGTGGIGRNPAQIDASLLKGVEVLRGPASTLHGSGGMGGVIAMTTKDAADFLDPGQTVGVTVRTGYRSATEDYNGTVAVYGKKGDLDLLAAATYHDTGDYRSSSPEAGESKADQDGYNGSGLFKASYQLGTDHKLALSVNTFNDKLETESSMYRSNQQRVTGTWDWIQDNGLVDLKANVQYTRRKDDMNNGIRDLVDEFNSLGFDVYNTFTGDFSKDIDWNLTVGTDASFDHQEGTDFGIPDPSRPDADARDLGAFTRFSVNLFDQVTITPATRYTHYEREADNTTAPDQSDDRWCPRVTAQWTPTKWFNLFGTYAETYRAPSMDDIYFEIEYPMPPGFRTIRVLPNPDLKPETAKTFEGGFGLKFENLANRSDRFRFKAVAFTEEVNDFITASTTPILTSTTMDFTNINVGEVERWGVELELGYEMGPLSFKMAYGMVDGEDQDSDEKTGTVPQNLTLSLGWNLPEKHLGFYWKSKFVDSTDYVLYATRDEVPGYAVHGVGAVWTPPVSWARNLRVDFGIDNLFDREYVNYRGGVDKGADVKLACTFSF